MKAKTNIKRTSISMLLIVTLIITMAVPAFAEEPQATFYEANHVSYVTLHEYVEFIGELDDNKSIVDLSSLNLYFSQVDNSHVVDALLAEQQRLLCETHALAMLAYEIKASCHYEKFSLFRKDARIMEVEKLIEENYNRFQEINITLGEMANVVFLTYEDLVNIGLISPHTTPPRPGNTTNVEYIGEAFHLQGVHIFRVRAIARNRNFASNQLTFQRRDQNLIPRREHTVAQFQRNIQTVGNNIIDNLPVSTTSSLLGTIVWNAIWNSRPVPNVGLYLDIEGTIEMQFFFASNNANSGFIHMQTSHIVNLNQQFVARYLNSNGVLITEGRWQPLQVVRSSGQLTALTNVSTRFLNNNFSLVRDQITRIEWNVGGQRMAGFVPRFFDTLAGMPI